MADFDDRALRTVMGQFCTGVVIATGYLDGEPAGFAAQSFFSLSLDPPLVGLCPAKSSVSWIKLRDSGSFCVNVLGADQQPISDIFAQTGIDKFVDCPWRPGVTGSPIIERALAFIDCDLEIEHDAGDHTIAVGRVRDIGVLDEERGPLLFMRGRYGGLA